VAAIGLSLANCAIRFLNTSVTLTTGRWWRSEARPISCRTVDTTLQNARNTQIPIWIADSRIAFAWLSFEIWATPRSQAVMLAPSSQARAPIQLGPPFQTGPATDPACAWRFFLDGNKVMLDLSDSRCSVPFPAHIVIEGAAELIGPTAVSH
jgi:hypothetical protein